MKGLELLHEHEQYIQKTYYLKNKIGLLKGSGLAEYMKITEELNRQIYLIFMLRIIIITRLKIYWKMVLT